MRASPKRALQRLLGDGRREVSVTTDNAYIRVIGPALTTDAVFAAFAEATGIDARIPLASAAPLPGQTSIEDFLA